MTLPEKNRVTRGSQGRFASGKSGNPSGRPRSRRSERFSFGRWKWLEHFYDVRTELTHFGTLLPILAEDKIVMEFTDAGQLQAFRKGRYEIPFTHLPSYLGDRDRYCGGPATVELRAFQQRLPPTVAAAGETPVSRFSRVSSTLQDFFNPGQH